MDPSRNLALQNAKLQAIQSTTGVTRRESDSDMPPPPPAYHTVVDPTEPLPNMHNPYDADEEDTTKDEDVPEINVNATTQIRGHGNIISIAQMDSMRIANLLAILIHGGIPPQPGQAPGPQPQPQVQVPAGGLRGAGERRELPKINININCGATVVGDRNIVGPGLGDIARHMQIVQQRQQQQAQQNQQNQDQTQRTGCNFPTPVPTPAPAQVPLATPPMSRSSSFGSEGAGRSGVKRKAEEEQRETPVKRAR